MTATTATATSATAIEAIKQKAKRSSILSMMSTTAAGSGHPTSCMSAAELVAGTFFYAMKFDPKYPNLPHGDRFVLSKGHAAPVLYAALDRPWCRGFPSGPCRSARLSDWVPRKGLSEVQPVA
jgi:transketolase